MCLYVCFEQQAKPRVQLPSSLYSNRVAPPSCSGRQPKSLTHIHSLAGVCSCAMAALRGVCQLGGAFGELVVGARACGVEVVCCKQSVVD